jgi:RNA polymerase sigma-70 factor (ECF subfamily)
MAAPDSKLTRPSRLVRVRDTRDVEAWGSFVSVYARLVYRYGQRKGLQDADAADLTQGVMSEIARGIQEPSPISRM